MFDFSALDTYKQKIYDNFKLTLCSKDSPLAKTKNEENFRICFENELNGLLRNLQFISNNYEIFLHETTTEFGRTDFQYGNTIIEYKKYNFLANDNALKLAQEQTQKYLRDKRFKGFKMFAFLFDGVKIYSYIKDELDSIISCSFR